MVSGYVSIIVFLPFFLLVLSMNTNKLLQLLFRPVPPIPLVPYCRLRILFSCRFALACASHTIQQGMLTKLRFVDKSVDSCIIQRLSYLMYPTCAVASQSLVDKS